MTYYNTQQEKLANLRATCAQHGLTFKKDDSLYLNGKAAYMIVIRGTDETISLNHTIDSAFDNHELPALFTDLKTAIDFYTPKRINYNGYYNDYQKRDRTYSR